MKTFSITSRYILISIFSICLLGLIFLFPKTSHAQVSVVVNGGSGSNAERQIVTLNRTIRDLVQRLVDKEYNLDPAATKQKNNLIAKYYQEQRAILASGDNGEAWFIQNLELYRAEIRTTTAGNAIDGLEESNICDAFKTEVITKLKQDYISENRQNMTEKSSCALDNATGGKTKEFLEGNFEEGGIMALWSIIQKPETTPMGSLLKNEGLVKEQEYEAEENALIRADWGDGTKSQYNGDNNVLVCSKTEVNGVRDGGDPAQRCRVVTPPSYLKAKAAGLANTEREAVLRGDELGETADDWIKTIIGQTETGGFTGEATSQSTPKPEPDPNPDPDPDPNPVTNPLDDPFPNVPNDPNEPITISLLGKITSDLKNSPASSTNPIHPYLERTFQKLQYELETVGLMDNVEFLIATTTTKYAPYSCYSVAFPNNFGNERTLTLTEIPETILSVKQLYVLYDAYEKAVADGSSTAQVIATFQELLRLSTAIPNQIELNDIAFKFETHLGGQVNSLLSTHNTQVEACELIVNPPEEENTSVDTNTGP